MQGLIHKQTWSFVSLLDLLRLADLLEAQRQPSPTSLVGGSRCYVTPRAQLDGVCFEVSGEAEDPWLLLRKRHRLASPGQPGGGARAARPVHLAVG